MPNSNKEISYAGFWIRVFAGVIDWLMLSLIVVPMKFLLITPDEVMGQTPTSAAGFMIAYVLPAVWIMMFWKLKGATPGKMLLRLKIVDAATFEQITIKQIFIRYAMYIIYILSLGLLFIYVAFNNKKQGLHDKVANTLVIRR